jgi:dinuclear metal center YbgI/SA1388 family protein
MAAADAASCREKPRFFPAARAVVAGCSIARFIQEKSAMPIARNILEKFLNELLQPERYADYGPNGLQVEGKDAITRAAFAVSATRDSIEAAIAARAEALIVHHGLLWDFHGVQPIRGAFGRRLRPLIEAQINLFGYHLPLDGHLEVGNAAGIAKGLGLAEVAPFGLIKGMPSGVQGRFDPPINVSSLQLRLESLLQHAVLVSTPQSTASIATIGIITGAANKYWRSAAESHLDAFLTGEMSEHDWHEAKEGGIHMFAGGHHATEVFGVQQLMQAVRAQLPIECVYLESANPA